MVNTLSCIVIPFIVPLIIGIVILRRANGDRLLQFAGWMTLKPLLATPIWYFFVSWLALEVSLQASVLANWVPGVALTLLLVILYRDALITNALHPSALRLLILDIVRWGSTALAHGLINSTALMGNNTFSPLGACFLPIAMLVPTVFAFYALHIVNYPDFEPRMRKKTPPPI